MSPALGPPAMTKTPPRLRETRSLQRAVMTARVVVLACVLAAVCIASAVALCAFDHSLNAILPGILGILLMCIAIWTSQDKLYQFSLEPLVKCLYRAKNEIS
jgi:hypothetical protein